MQAAIWNSVLRYRTNYSVIVKPHWRRNISVSHLHPGVRDFASSLGQTQPCFSVEPSNINVLSKPSQFYSTLLAMISRAKSRIFISSLYIGSSEHTLISALQASLSANPTLQLHLLLDLNRSTRPGSSSTASLLLPLLEEYPDRVHVSLFRSPKLRGILARIVPPRFNEGWGTWHAKIYGVDDEVLISGANLNDSYFTNRQDRYIHFTDQPVLANYCFGFMRTVSRFSYQLSLPSSKDLPGYALHWSNHEHPHDIKEQAQLALSEFQRSHLRQLEPVVETPVEDHGKVLVFPVVQAGQLDIREEEDSLTLLFSHLAAAKEPVWMDLTSGYFGLSETYQKLLLYARNVTCRILAASPQANGFLGSSGLSGRIPEGYTYLEQRFMHAVRNQKREWHDQDTENAHSGVQLSEWFKQDWTYHSKGIWLSPSSTEPPVLTLFGSTNLNSRSANLDTELSFIMILPDTPVVEKNVGKEDSGLELRRRLAQEVSDLRENARPWRGDQRNVRFGTKMMVAVVGGML